MSCPVKGCALGVHTGMHSTRPRMPEPDTLEWYRALCIDIYRGGLPHALAIEALAMVGEYHDTGNITVHTKRGT